MKIPVSDDNGPVSPRKSTVSRSSSSLYETVDDKITMPMPSASDSAHLSIGLLPPGAIATSISDSKSLGTVLQLPAIDSEY